MQWFAEARLLWLALAVVAIALVVSLRPGATDLHIRTAGLILQLLGIGTVAHGVQETRKFFGHPSLLTLLHHWLVRFPRWRRNVIVGTGSSSIGLTGFAARAYVWTPMNLSAPTEAQLKALTSNVERLKESLIQLQNEMDRELKNIAAALGEERASRSKDVADLQRRLELAETGGLHITFVGVIWLFVGVLLATLAPEILRMQS